MLSHLALFMEQKRDVIFQVLFLFYANNGAPSLDQVEKILFSCFVLGRSLYSRPFFLSSHPVLP